MKKVAAKYHDILLNNPQKYDEDYQRIYQELEDSPAYYRGKVIPFLYQPLFFKKKEVNRFEELTTKLMDIINKVIDRYLSSANFRSYFNFSTQLEELILADPGYNQNVPMARFDIFYYIDDKIKFCELNTDGSSGMVKTNTLEEAFLRATIIEELKDKYYFNYTELVDSWVDTLIDNYCEFNPNHSKPNIAIMDFSGYGMVKEFEHFKERISQRGYQVKIVDPRDLTYRNEKLYYEDFRIDLIYRRAVTLDLMKHYKQIEAFIQAYLDGNVCVVGSLRSQIIHNKIIFAILHDSTKIDFLSEEEEEFIADHIPLTRIIDQSNQELIDYIKDNKDKLVLKPMDLYGAEGVVVGQDLSQKEWNQHLSRMDYNYLAQEFCQVPEIETAVFKDRLSFKSFKYTNGLFLYNQKFKGLYTRAGNNNVIASATGCVTLPNLVVEEI